MAILKFASGRAAKWLVLAGWIAIVGVLASAALDFEDSQNNRDSAYLPKSAESLDAIHLEERGFGDELLTGLLAFRNDTGLTRSDRAAIRNDAIALDRKPVEGQFGPAVPGFLPDGKTAAIYLQVRARGDQEILFDAADRLRELAKDDPKDLKSRVTGQIGYFDDSVRVLDSIDGSLLAGTIALITLLLLLIYRSPFVWLLPLISVGFAELTSRGIGTHLAEGGTTVTTQAASLMTVLIFGVGTDYALLLIARYREELRRHEDKHIAMAGALRSSGPPIIASAATVAAALLCLTLADVNATSGTGPLGAMGIAIAMLAMLTLLPALLLIFGRRAFWPFVPKFGTAATHGASGFWTGLADRIAKRPRIVTLAIVVAMAVMSLGVLSHHGGLDLAQSFRDDVESVQGQRMLERALPPGATGPATILVSDAKRVPAVLAALETSPDVATVGLVQRGRGVVRIEASLKYAPYSREAIAAVPRIRQTVRAASRETAFVAGPSAVEADSREFAAKDNRLIMPIALLVVTLILIALLRSLVAPVVLVLTVVASFVAVLGVSYLAFRYLFGFAGIDEYLPLFVFIFLVALGVDYNIFLMARVREEAQKHGAREGMRRGLIVTGGLITSAGVVLAGTFLVLASMPLTMLTEIGVAIALGVLFDALVVRTALVPALGFMLGEKLWWPSSFANAERRASRPQRSAADGQPRSRDGASQGDPPERSGPSLDETDPLPDWTRVEP
ncbi:MAG: MMPL family transporter [Solirubrobacterales bacterium]